ncbi:MAG: hypothetical protein UV73_C0017G0001, partial [Candidatus Gottesmanbacteria bacterium GW2011_GWA2_43_14]
MPEILQEFINFLRSQNLSKNSIRNYQSDLNKFFSWFLVKTGHPLSADRFSNTQLELFFEDTASTVPPATLHRYRTSLRRFSLWLKPSEVKSSQPEEIVYTNNLPLEKQALKKVSLLSDSFAAYLAVKGLHRLSIRNYQADIQKFLNWFEKEKAEILTPENFQPDLINQYLEELKLQQIPEATVKRYLISVKHFFRFIHPEKLLPTTPKPYQKIAKDNNLLKDFPRISDRAAFYMTPRLLALAAFIFLLFIFSSVAGVRFISTYFQKNDRSIKNYNNISPDISSLDFDSFEKASVLASQTEKDLLEINIDTNINSALFVSKEASIAGLLSAPGGIVTSDLEANNISVNQTLVVGSGNAFQVGQTGSIESATGIRSSGTIAFTGLTAGEGKALCLNDI